MREHLQFSLGDATSEVARIPGNKPRERLETLRRSLLEQLAKACSGLRVLELYRPTFGLMRLVLDDIDEAVESWDVETLASARAKETRVAKACELIFAHGDPDGVERLRFKDFQTISDLADAVVSISRVLDHGWGQRRVLREFDVRVRGGDLNVVFTVDDTFDSAKYERLQVGHWLSGSSSDIADLGAAHAIVERHSDEPLPASLAVANRLFTDAAGVSLVGLLQVAVALHEHPMALVAGVHRSNFDVLVAEVEERSGLGEDAVRAALDFFSSDVAALRTAVYANGQPAHGANVRWLPLLRLPDGSAYYSPAVFSRMFRTSYLKAALTGSWPVRMDGPAARPFVSHMESRRSRTRPFTDFERLVFDEIRATSFGDHVVRNVQTGQNALRRIGIPLEFNTEIDAVAADPRRGILWVVSAKDSEQVQTEAQIKNQLKAFYGGNRDSIGARCHVATLRQQVDALRPHAATIAAALGVAAERGPWHTRGIFVTRIPSPAAADRRLIFPVVLADELGDYLEAPPATAPEDSPHARSLLRTG